MQATSRRVFVYNMDIETSKANARLPSASELTAIWDRRRRAGRGHVDIGSGDITVTLGDVVIDSTNQIASFLFRHSDKGAAESVYSDIRGGVFRPNAKATTEGGETGAHLFLSLAPEVNLVDRYTCIVEKVPYLDYSLMRRVLNKIIHDEYDEVANSFEYENLAGQRTREGLIRRDRCLPRIEFEGQPSANLAADIEDGHLNAITLVKAENNARVGGVPFLTKESSTLKLSIDQGNMPRNIWGSVRRALRAEAPQYPVAHVSVTPPGTTRSISIKVDASTGAPLGDLYTKSHDIIGISPPLRHSSDSVVSHFMRLIEPILIAERRI